MFKNILKITGILFLSGFSFFYTDKVTKIVRKNDPILTKINDKKSELEVMGIEPIIVDDEYIAGINGCKIDVDESYSKMKSSGKYNEELLVFSEIKTNKKMKNKYIVSGNKSKKNVSVIFIINKNIDNNLITFLNDKKVNSNFFISKNYLEKNSTDIKNISKNHSIYYYGNNGKYIDKNMIYDNNIINVNANNESNYCLTQEKNDETLKLCTSYDMYTIKSNFIQKDILNNTMENLSNGSILVYDSNNIDSIKVSINYILSKGYNIVSLDKLLNNNDCN